MAIRSSRLDSLEKKRADIQRRRNIAISLPLVGAALPFVALPLALTIASVCAMWTLFLDRQEEELETPMVWDRSYTEADLPDCDLRRSTFFGKTMPWVEWKERLDKVTNIKGVATADDVRTTLLDAYPGMIPFLLSDDIMTRHVALLAATGTGKTELILSIIQQQIKKGAGLILVEAKSDSDFSGAIYAMMKAAGRLDQFKLINFEFPEVSHTYNPFYFGGVRATLSTAMKMQANSKEEFWKDINRYSLSAAILCMRLQPRAPAFHLQDLLALISDFDLLKRYIGQIQQTDSTAHHDGQNFLYSYLRYWWDEEKEAFNTKHYKTMMTGVISKLSAFAHSEYARIVNTYNPDVDIKESILNGEVVVLSMSSLADKDGVELFGRLFISDLARAIGEIQVEKSKPLMICPAIFDEYPSFMEEGQVTLFQLARSANVPIIIAFQGVAFLQNISPSFVEMVLGNCWTHVYSDVKDSQTREFACKLAGTCIRKYEQETEAVSAGTGFSTEQSGIISNDSQGTSSSVGAKATREDLLQPEDFQTLDQGDAIIVAKSGTYRVRMPMVRNTFPSPHFSTMQLTKRHRRGREGIRAWEAFSEKNRRMFQSS